MIERSFFLKDEMGLHARPAAMLMVRMLHVSSSVEIICGDRRADGKDVMSIMAMNTTACLLYTSQSSHCPADDSQLPALLGYGVPD